MITFESKGSFKKTDDFLSALSKKNIYANLERYAREGVDALSTATPVDSGLTAASWDYEITSSKGSYSITWLNTNTKDGIPVAILLQYGHGTGTGGFVSGYDYINPALRPLFNKISDNVWKAVTSA